LTGSRIGAVGYLAGVIGRASAARWSGRPWDAVAHPVSVLALVGMLASSWAGRVRGSLHWKGRAI
jgi:hypothetical protein